jgi:hypothetical protein
MIVRQCVQLASRACAYDEKLPVGLRDPYQYPAQGGGLALERDPVESYPGCQLGR